MTDFSFRVSLNLQVCRKSWWLFDCLYKNEVSSQLPDTGGLTGKGGKGGKGREGEGRGGKGGKGGKGREKWKLWRKTKQNPAKIIQV